MKEIHASQSPLDTTTALMVIEEADLQAPPFYHVILLNDDYTPMDFVIDVLMQIFTKSYEDAYAIMMEVHHQTRGIAGTYPREIAEEKMQQALDTASVNEFPLQCIIETA